MPRLRSRKPSRDKEVAGSVKGSAKLKPLEVLHKATAAGWSSPRLPAPPVRKPVLADARYSSTAFDRAATKSNPFKAQVEVPTLMATVGDVAGLTVLDLGCGAGSYSRKLKEAGAKSVHGVDASPELVELAQQDERDAPLGSLTYQVGDVLSYRWVRSPVLPHVDLVLSAHLLSSAHNEAALSSFCRLALAALVPGGRFVSVLSTSGTYDQAAHGASPVKCFAATNESLGRVQSGPSAHPGRTAPTPHHSSPLAYEYPSPSLHST